MNNPTLEECLKDSQYLFDHPEAQTYFIDSTQTQLNNNTCGFNEKDLITTITVISFLGKNKDLLGHPKFNQFRQALRQLLGKGDKKKAFIKNYFSKNNVLSEIVCDMKIKKRKEQSKINDQLQKLTETQDTLQLTNHEATTSQSNNMLILKNQLEQLANSQIVGKLKNTMISYQKPQLNIQAQFSQNMLDEQDYQQGFNNIETQSPNIQISEELKQVLRQNINVHKKCYTCHERYQSLHFFYDQLCGKCGDLNYTKRNQKCDLTNKVALVTGGRTKIGYQIVLTLLRNGAHTIVTTRFPKNAAMQFKQEHDFSEWSNRLEIYALDFRFIPSVYEFCQFMKNKYNGLDIIINNAAQTIRRSGLLNQPNVEREFEIDLESISYLTPNDFKNISLDKLLQENISEIKEVQSKLKNQSTQSFQVSKSSLISLMNLDMDQNVPRSSFITDINNEVVDLNHKNSWVKELDEVSVSEFMEVNVINVCAPFIICSQLKSLMEKSKDTPRFIVNVSAMEGQFYKFYKNSTHPHTNMAKAALNMMTRTSGCYYALSQIYMNAADTGWVTDEKPHSFQQKVTPPLDELDGAMRVLDCIFQGYLTKNYIHSRFFKDYQETYW